jgi:hypothetical protein
MLNLFSTHIESLYCNKVGNKSRNEELLVSKHALDLDGEEKALLREFFLSPFRKKGDEYFTIESDQDLAAITKMKYSHEINDHVANHLYNCGRHPHIKSGELFVAELSNIIYDNNSYIGIGIFKSELRNDFLKFDTEENQLVFHLDQGVSLSKLDKGLIILLNNNGSIERVLTHDSNQYDTKYWKEEFAGLSYLKDEHYDTRKYLKFVSDFSKEIPEKKDQIEFVNNVHQHFASVDEFHEEDFIQQEIPYLADEFSHFKLYKGEKYDIDTIKDFQVSNTVVNDSIKKIKSKIELDTGITIDFGKGTPAHKYITKCFDHEEQMYYYKVKFNKEL